LTPERPVLSALDRIVASATTSGRQWVRFTAPQRAFLSRTDAVLLWRGGNQIGKSTALAVDAVDFARGAHIADQTHTPPVRVMVMGPSWEQMEPLMRRIWEVVPRAELDPRNGYDPGRGITGKPPRLLFASGPGRGSVIQFATYEQGAKRLAGATLHRIVLDEPPPEDVYAEAIPRVLRMQGHVRIGCTPTPGMADLGYLRAKVTVGDVPELVVPLTEASCWPEGALRPWLTQAQIDRQAALWPARERGMRLRGEWEPLAEGAWLSAFDEQCISDEAPPPGAWLVVSGDHGTEPGKQRFVLSAMMGHDTDRPRAWFIAEYAPDGFSTPEQDAEGVLGMLRAAGLEYDHVDDWVADRSAQTRDATIKKENARLRAEIARLLRRPAEGLKWIYTPRKYEGSVVDGYRLFNALFARRDERGRPHGLIHPRCQHLIAAARVFKGREKEPAKDILDGARYGLERAIRRRDWIDLPATYRYRSST
jgi:phage terminase large subunit-like protein